MLGISKLLVALMVCEEVCKGINRCPTARVTALDASRSAVLCQMAIPLGSLNLGVA